ncbi:MAG: transcriptional regulator [Stutzerimonas stutzeri]|nr:MAG: transcriptional regulator [Stutzerimonas stutzeri]
MESSDNDHANTHAKTILRPIVGLTRGLPKSVLELLVVEAIRKHRYLRDLAEMRETESRQPEGSEPIVGPAGTAYVRAMIDLHAHQTVLSTLLDVLGYIPDVPTD